MTSLELYFGAHFVPSLTDTGFKFKGYHVGAAVSEVGAMESQGGVAGIGTERRAMRGERGSYFRDGSTQSF